MSCHSAWTAAENHSVCRPALCYRSLSCCAASLGSACLGSTHANTGSRTMNKSNGSENFRATALSMRMCYFLELNDSHFLNVRRPAPEPTDLAAADEAVAALEMCMDMEVLQDKTASKRKSCSSCFMQAHAWPCQHGFEPPHGGLPSNGTCQLLWRFRFGPICCCQGRLQIGCLREVTARKFGCGPGSVRSARRL